MLQVTSTLEWGGGIKDLPRLAYALLRSPLLAANPKGHPDLRAAVHHLWMGLPPALLHKAVYPALMSFKDPDTLVQHSSTLALILPLANKLPEYL